MHAAATAHAGHVFPTAAAQASFVALLSCLGLHVHDSGGSCIVRGCDPILPSVHALGQYAGLAMLAAAHAAVSLGRSRTGQGQDLEVDLQHAVLGLNPERLFGPTLNGYPYSTALLADNPFLTRPYVTRDGQYVMLSGLYPHMVTALSRFLQCPQDAKAVATVVAGQNGRDLEQAGAKAGLAITLCRTQQAWQAHPQGMRLQHTPPVEITRIGDSPPRPKLPARRPLQGYRVLSFGRALAGPIVGRTLAEQGADVLGVTHPNHFEHEAVYCEANVGQRSCALDFKQADARAQVSRLASRADVIVNNHQTPKLRQWGLDGASLVAQFPGLVTVSISGFGNQGPWAGRLGFDMNASAATGIMMAEGQGHVPCLPPSILAHDIVAGYLGAAGAAAALKRQAQQGGSYHVQVNLARCAMWCQAQGAVAPQQASKKLLAAHTFELIATTPLGRLRRLAPCVRFSHTPAVWPSPILVCRGSSAPAWTAACFSGRPNYSIDEL